MKNQSRQVDACRVRGIDVKAVDIDFIGFAGLHQSYLLDLKFILRLEKYIYE